MSCAVREWAGSVLGEMAYVHVKAGVVAGVRVGYDHLFQSGGGFFGPVLEARVVGCCLGCGGKA